MKASYMEWVSILRERRISIISLKPRVVIMAVRATLLVTRALVAAVVPCTINPVFRINSSSDIEKAAAASPTALITPSEKSPGVLGDLNSRRSPFPSRTTQSVKVPPVSTHTLNIYTPFPRLIFIHGWLWFFIMVEIGRIYQAEGLYAQLAGCLIPDC